ncbi:MAG: hypothetical protein ACRDHL_13050 [Candidatus Promineifilaceae bacterium]
MWAATGLLIVGLLAQWSLLFIVRTPAWDATFYYAYARSLVFDRDLAIGNDLRLSYATTSPDFASNRYDLDLTPTGWVTTPFALGSGLLWLPWLALLRAAAVPLQAAGRLPAALTGYEPYFVAGVSLLSMLLGWLAHWLGYRLAGRTTGRLSALAATLTVAFATPLLYYQYREPLYSHATSALTAGLAVAVWWRGHERAPSPGRALGLGALIGLAALVRWQQLVYLALPAASSLAWWWAQPAGRRGHAGRRAALALGLTGLAAAVVLLPQLFQWRLVFGRWLTVPQGGVFLDWRAPFLGPVLFSTYRGLLPWLPVALLAAAGLGWLARSRPRLALPLLLVLALELYVAASTRDWFGGGGFGPRRFASELVILIVGYAAFLDGLSRRLGRWPALPLGLLLALHQWTLLRYGLVERIGGRNLSMFPDYRWQDGPLAYFLAQLAGRAASGLAMPWDFFVFPSSPLALLSRGQYPAWQAALLIVAAMVVGASWLLARRLALPGRLQQPAERPAVGAPSAPRPATGADPG